jgi:hypothetical protein
MEITKKINRYYEKLIIRGYSINITTQHGGWAYMYAVQNGKRLPGIRVMFRSNNVSASKITERAPTAREHSHLGKAIVELLVLIEAQPELNQQTLQSMIEEFSRLNALRKNKILRLTTGFPPKSEFIYE